MAASPPQLRGWDRSACLALVLGCGLGFRVLAAVVVQQYVQAKEPARLCIFPDADIYWRLAQTIRVGGPYQVSLWGIPHYALRTPGYPLFLAACQAVCRERGLLVRLIQATLGAGCAWLVYRLIRQLWPDEAVRVALWAAALVAVEPYVVALSVLILSEALFVPLMLATLWGMAVLWPVPGAAELSHRRLWAMATGLAAGSAIQMRPSWSLFVPAMLLIWIAARARGQGQAQGVSIASGNAQNDRAPTLELGAPGSLPASGTHLSRRKSIFERSWQCSALFEALLVCLGIVVVMSPWWVRNARVFGRFVPTALWAGSSLYDGLNPSATGASDMRFLDQPEIRSLDESTLDTTLWNRAWDFVRAHPTRAFCLALIKSARFWSPWPNTEAFTAPGIAWASALITLPVYTLMIVGAWDRRRDLRTLVLLAGPLLYFWALHTLFVGSVRYRIPGSAAAMALAALGLERLLKGGQRSVVRPEGVAL